jgi:hypothetical protein
MAEQTVLTMVQNILSRMSSDEVNSIGDTTESMQVAQILQNKYYDIVARGSLTIDETLFQLVPSDNATNPVMMLLPQGVSRIDWLQYFDTNPLDNTQTSQFGSYKHSLNTNLVSSVAWTTTSSSTVTIPSSPSGSVVFVVASSTLPVTNGQLVQASSGSNSIIGNVSNYTGTNLSINVTSTVGAGTFSSWIITSINVPNVPPGYKYVEIVPIDYFLNIVNRYDISQAGTFAYNFNDGLSNFTFRYRNDHQPTMCTVIQNNWVLFDSFDGTQDSTLQASKTMAFGQIVPVFLLQDNFVPRLDDQQFPLLLNEATSLAFYELKQMPHAKADEEVKRQWAVAQKTKSKANKPTFFDQLSNFGRVPRTGGYGGYPPNLWMRNSLGNSASLS